MPTVFTNDIEKGITFKQYAMQCARAFGACIEIRDEPLGKEIPSKFKVSNFYGESLKDAKKELELIKKLTIKECNEWTKKEYDCDIDYYTKQLKDIKLISGSKKIADLIRNIDYYQKRQDEENKRVSQRND